MEYKLCNYCGRKFIPSSKINKYCSALCGYKYNYEKHKPNIIRAVMKRRKEHPEIVKKQRKKLYHTEKWKEKRKSRYFAQKYLKEILFKKYNYQCAQCKSRENLEIHHLKYTLSLDDLILLCKECHGKQHRIEEQRIRELCNQ